MPASPRMRSSPYRTFTRPLAAGFAAALAAAEAAGLLAALRGEASAAAALDTAALAGAGGDAEDAGAAAPPQAARHSVTARPTIAWGTGFMARDCPIARESRRDSS